MLHLLLMVIPVFLVLFLGKGLQIAGLIDAGFIRSANRLVYAVFLPVLLFDKISGADLGQAMDIPLLLILAATVLSMFGLGSLIARTRLVPGRTRGSFVMNCFRGNFAYMGLPVSYSAFGEPGLLYASILIAVIVPLVNLLSIVSLGLFSGRTSTRNLLRDSLLNPLVIACMAGLAFSLAGIALPDFIRRTLHIISGVTLPLALCCIGASLDIGKVRGNLGLILLASGCKLLLMPVLALALLRLFRLPAGTMADVLVIMVASPVATINYILASTLDGDPESTSGTIVISTLLSIFSYVFWLGWLAG